MITTEEIFTIVNKQLQEDLPFVVYKFPNENRLGILIQSTNTVYRTRTFEEQGFVFAPFDSEKEAILLPGSPTYAKDFDFDTIVTKQLSSVRASEFEKDSHIALVEKAIDRIIHSDLQKVVISRKQKIDTQDFNALDTFKRLGSKYATAFVYLWYHPKVGMWLGATPESLLSINGRSFETVALAGTQPYSSGDIIWGAKEQEEQELVTRDIVSNLENFKLLNFKRHGIENHRAGDLLHLRTRITGTFSTAEVSIESLLKALHPTPAVCGFPREDAKNFIFNNENYPRSFYTGFLGELNIFQDKSKPRNRRNVENLAYKTLSKSTQLFVNLRCMQYKDQAANLYIGGGITKDSNAVNEWEETVNKAQTIASIL